MKINLRLDEDLNQPIKDRTPVPPILPPGPNQNAKTVSPNSLIIIDDTRGFSLTVADNMELGFDEFDRPCSPIHYCNSDLVGEGNNVLHLSSDDHVKDPTFQEKFIRKQSQAFLCSK